jgi:hypothetical protein
MSLVAYRLASSFFRRIHGGISYFSRFTDQGLLTYLRQTRIFDSINGIIKHIVIKAFTGIRIKLYA